MQKYTIAIHGGAGALADTSTYKESVARILEVVKTKAEAGDPAMDLVMDAVVMLEDDPLFNAGKGSVLNAEGKVECDAAIMDGTNLEAGSVAAVAGVKNPIVLARKVIEQSPHVMLIGAGARIFADTVGVEIEEMDYFVTEARKKQLEQAQKEGKIVLDHSDVEEKKLGTVGAVAMDLNGNLAAATSTGGIVNKQFGRVGDTSIVGAGVYAENATCAVSATGYGEQFIRTTLAKHIAEIIRHTGVDAKTAAQQGIDYLVAQVKGLGGVIMIDKNGEVAHAHSTPVILGGSVSSRDDRPILFF
jgi:beta-aspartyl-peptidase (threonine type)